MFVIGMKTPADIIDSIGDREERDTATEDLFFETCQPPCGGLAPFAKIDELDFSIGVSE